MTRLKLFLVFQLFLYSLFAQKPSLTINDLGKWPSVDNPKISNDGRYVIYNYQETESHYLPEQQTLVVKSSDNKWKRMIPGTTSYNAVITENSKYVIGLAKDTLLVITLGGNIERIPGVISYKTPQQGHGEWLAYQLTDKDKILVLRNFITGREKRYDSVVDYLFSENGEVLVTKTTKDKLSTLQWLNLQEDKNVNIWKGEKAGNYSIDPQNVSLSFIATDPANKSGNALWYYYTGMDSSIVLANDNTEGIDKGLRIRTDQLLFNKDGSKIFFYLEPKELPKPKLRYTSVDVWSWNDAKLQSQQLSQINKPKKYLAVLNTNFQKFTEKRVLSNISKPKIFRIESENETSVVASYSKADYVLVSNRVGDITESHWNNFSLLDVYLISTNDGSKKLIKKGVSETQGYFYLSPEEKYVFYYDNKKKSYFSYEIASQKLRDITSAIPVGLNAADEDMPISKYYPYGVAGWLQNDKSILVYDKYDIWQVDPSGSKAPNNVTNGFGVKNKVRFRFSMEDLIPQSVVHGNEKLILLAFSEVDKRSSIYYVSIGEKGNPQLLSSHPSIFKIQKAKHASIYLVALKSIDKPLNYYVTRDLFKFQPISDVSSPSEKYNWFSSELVKWTSFKNEELEGILYKPNNFDSTKKYPVIFYFYEKLSHKLNEFIPPIFGEGPLPISFFVSNGYLVFTPDIKYQVGNTGESVCNSVVSAAKYLGRMKYVDSTKMGIMGHSFGGYEVNYLVTHTNIFSAGISASGLSNLISYYGSAMRFGYSINWAEQGQGRLGGSIWDNPEMYINNSPIFKASEVSTPILLMSNKNDGSVPFGQGVEFFTALRRLGKTGWMLQYDNGEHDVSGEDAKDFTKRITQFFDHYLKSAPPPIWMSQGIPARLKGIQTGYAYDPSGSCGPTCKICKYWNDKMKKDSAATLQEIEKRKIEEHWQ